MKPNIKPIDPTFSQYAWFRQGSVPTNPLEDEFILFYWDGSDWQLCPGPQPNPAKGTLRFAAPCANPINAWSANELRLITWWYQNPGVTDWSTTIRGVRDATGLSLRETYELTKIVLDRLWMQRNDQRAGHVLTQIGGLR